ncbi:MAG: copper chaperone PCu(A)C [Proteobacteria bacterium]|nr:copper chaperone PCu(A)C [Pseudomonadota bacterium]
MMMSLRLALACALVTLLPVGAFAHDYKLGALEISQPWARATAPAAPAGGGYLTITNKGTTSDRLMSVRSPAADKVEVHEMKMDGNIMRMRAVEHGLEIAPGATVKLAPGGFHLMMMGLKGPLKQGTRVPLTLTFEKAGSIDVELAVGGMGATQPPQD